MNEDLEEKILLHCTSSVGNARTSGVVSGGGGGGRGRPSAQNPVSTAAKATAQKMCVRLEAVCKQLGAQLEKEVMCVRVCSSTSSIASLILTQY